MRGITVELYDRVQVDVDPLYQSVYRDRLVNVENVLVAPASAVEVANQNNLYGGRIDYVLAIPKGDAHDWSAGKKVGFFGQEWIIVEIPEEGIDWLIPLSWNKKVMVMRYEQG